MKWPVLDWLACTPYQAKKNQVNFGMDKTKISWQIAAATMIRFTPTPPKPNQDQQSNRFYPLNQLTALYAIV